MSTIRFLADENFRGQAVRGLHLKFPSMDLTTVQESGLSGKPDPVILAQAAEMKRVLISHDLKTMPAHLMNFLAGGQHSAGLILISQDVSTSDIIDALELVWLAGDSEEWIDSYDFLPWH